MHSILTTSSLSISIQKPKQAPIQTPLSYPTTDRPTTMSNAKHRPRYLAAVGFTLASLACLCPSSIGCTFADTMGEVSSNDSPLTAMRHQDAQTRASSSQKIPLVARLEGTLLVLKILQFADLHFTGDPTHECRNPPQYMIPSDCKEALMTKFMTEVLDVEQPDMVVFTGDNVETLDTNHHQVAMDSATNLVEEQGIPWAMVFGNHDEDNGFPLEEMFAIAASKNHSYIQHGPQEVDGVGNYELSVMDPTNSLALLRLYFLDSHGSLNKTLHSDINSTYDWIKPSQIEYYKNLSDSHRNQRVPSLMFFHIPIPEYEVNGSDGQRNGDDQTISGEHHEPVSSSSVNTKLLATLVEQDEVKAVFVGHDHVNEYCVQRYGIELCYGGGSGFGRGYGSATVARRVRVIEWRQQANGLRTIRSWKRHHNSILLIHHSEVLYLDKAVAADLNKDHGDGSAPGSNTASQEL